MTKNLRHSTGGSHRVFKVDGYPLPANSFRHSERRVAATESSRWMVIRYPLTHSVILSEAKNLSSYPLSANLFRHYHLPTDIDSRHPRIR